MLFYACVIGILKYEDMTDIRGPECKKRRWTMTWGDHV